MRYWGSETNTLSSAYLEGDLFSFASNAYTAQQGNYARFERTGDTVVANNTDTVTRTFDGVLRRPAAGE